MQLLFNCAQEGALVESATIHGQTKLNRKLD